MTSLYSCRSLSPVEFRISKFDSDFNLQSSYVMSNGGCDCPQGHKPTCRHRKMLPEFAKQGHIGDGWFFDWDTRLWRKPVAGINNPEDWETNTEFTNDRVNEPSTGHSPPAEVEGRSFTAKPGAVPSEGVEQQQVVAFVAPPSPLGKIKKRKI